MKYRKSVFVVTYAKSKNKIFYLILKRRLHWKGWEFPKGKIELLEFKRNTAKREVFEETGLKPIKVKKFNVKGKYKYSKKIRERPGQIGQKYNLFSVEVKKGKVSVSEKEHSDYKWVEFEKAIRKLTWANQRKSLKVVNDWLVK